MSALHQLPLHPSVEWIQSNRHGLIALNKGVGVMAHPNRLKDRHAALLDADYDLDSQSYSWTNAQGREEKLWLLHRLDSPTSGVILLAKHEALADSVRQVFAEKAVKKVYYAIVKGCPQAKVGQWNQKLKQNPYQGSPTRAHSIRARSTRAHSQAPESSPAGRMISAKTHYRLEGTRRSTPILSRLKLEPITGRTHQLRVHCSLNRLPIVGDQSYGDFKFNRACKKSLGVNRLCLHAEQVAFDYPWKGKVHSFSAKAVLPEVFNVLCP